MADRLHQIMTYASRAYHNNLGRDDKLAQGYVAIVDKTNNIIQGTNDPADLVRWLNQSHLDPNVLKACQDVLKHA